MGNNTTHKIKNRAVKHNMPGFSVDQAELLLKPLEDLIFILDIDRNFVKCFQPQSSGLAITLESFLGKNIESISFPPGGLALIQASITAAEETGITQTIDYNLPINGISKWFNCKISKIESQDGFSGFIIVSRDVTALRESMQLLQANEEKYQLLADNMTDLVALYSPDGIIEYISPSVYRLLGYDPGTFTGINPAPFIHPEDNVRLHSDFHPDGYHGDEFFSAEYRARHRDGHWVHFSTNRRPIRNAKGEIIHILATCRNITEKKQTDEVIKKSEAHYKMLADNILDLVALHDSKGIFEYVSPSSFTVLGYMPDELIGINAFTLIHPRESKKLWKKNSRLAGEGRDTFIDEFRISHKKGHWVYFETTTKVIKDAEGKSVKFLTTSRDVTEWKLSQFALAESEEKYRSLVESSDAMIAMLDMTGKFLYVNDMPHKFLNGKKDKIIGKTIYDVFDKNVADVCSKQFNIAISENKKVIHEFPVDKNGEHFWIRATILPMKNAEGKTYAAMANCIDITSVKESEEKLLKQNKELKEIAFLQSHILRAPLSNIMGLLSLLDKETLSDENKALLNLLEVSADNLDEAVKQIVEKTYSAKIE